VNKKVGEVGEVGEGDHTDFSTPLTLAVLPLSLYFTLFVCIIRPRDEPRYPLDFLKRRFSRDIPLRKQGKIYFRSREGFCLASLRVCWNCVFGP
jgi:hypothetical protein